MGKMARVRSKAGILMILLFVGYCIPAYADVFYVSSGIGKDTRTATEAKNRTTAWQTISRGVQELKPGDKLVVLEGTYLESGIEIPSGMEGRYVELLAEGRVQVKVGDVGTAKQQFIFQLKNEQYVKISGFTLICEGEKGPTPIGFHLSGSRHNLIENNIIKVEKGYGVYLGQKSSDNTVKKNQIFGCNTGIVMAMVNENQIVGNDIYENSGVGVILKQGNGNLLSNNLIVKNKDRGISYEVASGQAETNKNRIVHCVVWGNSKQGITNAEGEGPPLLVSDSIIANNLWAQLFIYGGGRLETDYNCVYGNRKGEPQPGKNDIHEDPSFEDAENLDFHLQEKSPCKQKAGDSKDIGLLEPRKIERNKTDTLVSEKEKEPIAKPAEADGKNQPLVWRIGIKDGQSSEFTGRPLPGETVEGGLNVEKGVFLCDLGKTAKSNLFPSQIGSGGYNHNVFYAMPQTATIRWIDDTGGARRLKFYLCQELDKNDFDNDFSIIDPVGQEISLEVPVDAQYNYNTEFVISAKKGLNELSIKSNYPGPAITGSYLIFDCLELWRDESPSPENVFTSWQKDKAGSLYLNVTNSSEQDRTLSLETTGYDLSGHKYFSNKENILVPGNGIYRREKLSIQDKADKSLIRVQISDPGSNTLLKDDGYVFWDNLGKVHAEVSLKDAYIKELIRNVQRNIYYRKNSAGKSKIVKELEEKRGLCKEDIAAFENGFIVCYKNYREGRFLCDVLLDMCRKLTSVKKEYNDLTAGLIQSFPEEYRNGGLERIGERAVRLGTGLSNPREELTKKTLFIGHWYTDPQKIDWNEGFLRKMDYLALGDKYAMELKSPSIGPGKWDFTIYEQGVTANKEQGFSSDISAPFSTPWLPDWLVEKCGGKENVFSKNSKGQYSAPRFPDILNPAFADYCRGFYKALSENFKDRDDVVAYEILNEPSMAVCTGWDYKDYDRGGYSEAGVAKFREFLKQQYHNIAKINSIYGTSYQSFDEILPPKSALKEKIQPLEYEWEEFRSESNAQFLAGCYQTIRENDKQHLIIPQLTGVFNGMAYVPAGQIWGIDVVKYQKAINSYVDYFSFHSSGLPATIYISNLAGYFHKPMSQDEYYWNAPGIGFGEEVSSIATQRNMWESLAYGCRLFEFFTIQGYDKAQYTSVFNPVTGHHLMRRSTAELSVMKDKAEKYQHIFNTTSITENNEVAILQPTISTKLQFPPFFSQKQALRLHEMLLDNYYTVSYVPEEFVLDGTENIQKYKIVILPYATYFPDGLANYLTKYVKNGGVLIASGVPDIYDRHGRKDAGLLREMFGEMDISYLPDAGVSQMTGWTDSKGRDIDMMISSEGVYELKLKNSEGIDVYLKTRNNLPVLLEKRYGKGKFFLSTVPIGDKKYFEQILLQLVGDAISVRKTWSENSKNLHFVLRNESKNPENQYLCVINRDIMQSEMKAQENEICLKGNYREIIDLDLEKKIDFSGENGVTRFKTLMYPGQGLLFRLKKAGDGIEGITKSTTKGTDLLAVNVSAARQEKEHRPLIMAYPASEGLQKYSYNKMDANEVSFMPVYENNVLQLITLMPGAWANSKDIHLSVFLDSKNNALDTDGRFEDTDYRFSFGTDGEIKSQYGHRGEDVLSKNFYGLKTEISKIQNKTLWTVRVPLDNISINAARGLKIGFGIMISKGETKLASWPGSEWKEPYNTKEWGEMLFVDDVGNLSKQFSPDEEGFVKNWLIAGPFPNLGGKYTCKGWDYDFLKESGGEQACVAKIDDSFKSFQTEDIIDKNLIGFSDLANSGMLQKEYVTSWKARESKDKFVNLESMFVPNTYIVSYAFCNIKVEEEKELWLGLGSDDGAKVWLNHAEVLNAHSHRAAKVDEDLQRIRLKKGINHLLLKVDTDVEGYGFYLRFLEQSAKGETKPFKNFQICF